MTSEWQSERMVHKDGVSEQEAILVIRSGVQRDHAVLDLSVLLTYFWQTTLNVVYKFPMKRTM